MVELFAAGKVKKNESKNRKAMWFEYMLAEASTKDISQAVEPKNFVESKKVAKQGGNVAKVARKELEAKTDKKVVSPINVKTVLGEKKKTKRLNLKKKK